MSSLSCHFLPLKFSDVLSISPQKENGPLCKFNFCSLFKRNFNPGLKKKKNHLKIGIEYFVKLKPKVVNVSTA